MDLQAQDRAHRIGAKAEVAHLIIEERAKYINLGQSFKISNKHWH